MLQNESLQVLKSGLREAVRKDPLDALLVTVCGGSMLFFLAEKDHNPRIKTPWDAFMYVSTCLSVGYADMHAKTPAGKAIATALMTLGPSMAAAAFDPTARETAAERETDRALQRDVIAKLDSILKELKRG